MRFKIVIPIFMLMVSYMPGASAQSACDNALYEADKMYEAGKFEECINTLKACANSERNREYRMQSFRLLALSHLKLNDESKARPYIKSMLALKPDYQKYPGIDPIEFSRLVSSYSVNPKIMAGIKFGFNINSIALEKSYSTYVSSQRYEPAGGFQLGLTGSYNLSGNRNIYGDLVFSGVDIHHVIDDAGGWKQQYFEQQQFYQFNLGLNQQIAKVKATSFFVGLGMGMGYMNRADVYLESSNLQTESIQQASRNAIEDRNRWQISGQAKAGISRQLTSGLLSIDAGWSYYLKNTVNAENRMNDMNFIYNNQYINDDIRLQLFAVNVQYQMPIKWEIKAKN